MNNEELQQDNEKKKTKQNTTKSEFRTKRQKDYFTKNYITENRARVILRARIGCHMYILKT